MASLIKSVEKRTGACQCFVYLHRNKSLMLWFGNAKTKDSDYQVNPVQGRENYVHHPSLLLDMWDKNTKHTTRKGSINNGNKSRDIGNHCQIPLTIQRFERHNYLL